MRLASKIFLTSALVIVVLAGVAALSLRAIDRLVSANRDIVTRTSNRQRQNEIQMYSIVHQSKPPVG